ncbi:MAG TPA: hypothetical protein VKZ92_01280, partial [Pseudohongiella sp.]|nr:hypothetical protein [Pseudohongiella sp.]
AHNRSRVWSTVMGENSPGNSLVNKPGRRLAGAVHISAIPRDNKNNTAQRRQPGRTDFLLDSVTVQAS